MMPLSYYAIRLIVKMVIQVKNSIYNGSTDDRAGTYYIISKFRLTCK